MKDIKMNIENERESMKVAHQLVESRYDSRQDFINRAKFEVNRNFEAFVKNEKPDDPTVIIKKSPTFVEDLIVQSE